jgi:hypothetical protein
MDELSAFQTADLGHHAGQQTVACNVEWNAQAEIARPLVHLTGKRTVRDIELSQDVAGRQGHLVERCRVPCGDEHAATFRIGFELVDYVLDLVNSFAFVILVHRFILGAKVPPLESVHGPQIPLLTICESNLVEEFSAGISVPDLDFLVVEQFSVGFSVDEPE